MEKQELEKNRINAEENYVTTPISVLKYISSLESALTTLPPSKPLKEIIPEATQEMSKQETQYERQVAIFGEESAKNTWQQWMLGYCFAREKAMEFSLPINIDLPTKEKPLTVEKLAEIMFNNIKGEETEKHYNEIYNASKAIHSEMQSKQVEVSESDIRGWLMENKIASYAYVHINEVDSVPLSKLMKQYVEYISLPIQKGISEEEKQSKKY